LCLVDEVHSGGSITKNFDYINGALRIYYPEVDFDLEAVGICGQQEKCRKFNQLRDMGRLTPFYTDNLFTVDKTRYLSPLVRVNGDVVQEGRYPKDLKGDLYKEIARIHTGE